MVREWLLKCSSKFSKNLQQFTDTIINTTLAEVKEFVQNRYPHCKNELSYYVLDTILCRRQKHKDESVLEYLVDLMDNQTLLRLCTTSDGFRGDILWLNVMLDKVLERLKTNEFFINKLLFKCNSWGMYRFFANLCCHECEDIFIKALGLGNENQQLAVLTSRTVAHSNNMSPKLYHFMQARRAKLSKPREVRVRASMHSFYPAPTNKQSNPKEVDSIKFSNRYI